MTNIKALLQQAKRRSTTQDVCLRGDLASRYEELGRELAELPDNNKLGGDPNRERIESQMDEVREQMQAGTVPFVMRALPQPDFQRLVDAHPPRRDGDEVNQLDASYGFNRSTFFPALFRASVVDPQLDDDDWAVLFAQALSTVQVMGLGMEAYRLNAQDVDVPFSRAASNGSPD